MGCEDTVSTTYDEPNFGTLYRYEQSGELHGLMRVDGFTQDYTHMFNLSEQLAKMIKTSTGFIRENAVAVRLHGVRKHAVR